MTYNMIPRYCGHPSMFRIPFMNFEEASGMDVIFLGVPSDGTSSAKVGARFGPHQIRSSSFGIRQLNPETGAMPFDSGLKMCDVGNLKIDQMDATRNAEMVNDQISLMLAKNPGVKLLSMGGDHLISYPILKALKKVHGPLALIHLDAHSDTADSFDGHKLYHGSVFRRAMEDGCLIPGKLFQLGIRGSWYTSGIEERKWAKENGFIVIPKRAITDETRVRKICEKILKDIGPDTPTYLSIDIDGFDPSIAPGTGTQEPDGLTARQGMSFIRICKELNLVGMDIVEVVPTMDGPAQITSVLAAHLAFEGLCTFKKVKYHKTFQNNEDEYYYEKFD